MGPGPAESNWSLEWLRFLGILLSLSQTFKQCLTEKNKWLLWFLWSWHILAHLDTASWHSLHPPQTPSVITMAWSVYLGKSRRKSLGLLIWLLVSNMCFNPVWDDGPQMSTISLYIFRGSVETSNQSYMDVYGFRLHRCPESARPWVQQTTCSRRSRRLNSCKSSTEGNWKLPSTSCLIMFNESRCKIQFHYPVCLLKKARFGNVEQGDRKEQGEREREKCNSMQQHATELVGTLKWNKDGKQGGGMYLKQSQGPSLLCRGRQENGAGWCWVPALARQLWTFTVYYDPFSMVLCKSRMHTVYKNCFPDFLICFLALG